MQEYQRVRLLAILACGLHRLVDVREEGIPLLPLYALDPQVVVAQVAMPQTFPEGCADIADFVRRRHMHLHSAAGDAVVSLSGVAIVLRRGPAVGGKPYWIDHIFIGRATAKFSIHRKAAVLEQFRLSKALHQGANMALQTLAVIRFHGEALQNGLFNQGGAVAITSAYGIFQFPEQIGE